MIYELWVITNWILSFIGIIYSAKEDDMPMAIGWSICFIGWSGFMR